MAARPHKVQFRNLQTRRGYINGYTTKRYALKVVEEYAKQLERDGGKGVQATYLGDERQLQKAKS